MLPHDMRPHLAIVVLSGCLGCSCADEGLPPAPAAAAEVRATPIALSAPCTPGVALGSGYARINEIPSLGGTQVARQHEMLLQL